MIGSNKEILERDWMYMERRTLSVCISGAYGAIYIGALGYVSAEDWVWNVDSETLSMKVVVEVMGVDEIIQGKYLNWRHNPTKYQYSIEAAHKGDLQRNVPSVRRELWELIEFFIFLLKNTYSMKFTIVTSKCTVTFISPNWNSVLIKY